MNSPSVDRHQSRCRSIAGHGASAIILASLLLPGCSRQRGVMHLMHVVAGL